MAQEYIELRGARENNLKNVSLKIPKRRITVFTGVSGSGKSSIVFDTIATEALRLLNENFSTFVRTFLPRHAQPDADAIENLGMAVVVDQRRMGGGSHSTVGTITDISPLLRLLFSRLGEPHVGPSNAFSFNDPQGMCPECHGVGKSLGGRSEDFLDMSRSLNEGAVRAPVFSAWERDAYKNCGFFDNDKKVKDFTADEMDLLLHGKARRYTMSIGNRTINLTYMGIIEKFNVAYITRDIKTMSARTQKLVASYLTYGPCPLCKGARLSQAALACRVDGHGIAELSSMEAGDLVGVVRSIKGTEAAPLVAGLAERLGHLVDIGLDYLSLDRETDTLSGGEAQRVKIVKHLGSSLVDVMYIFDEPSIGMHPRDVHRMNELLVKLRDKGNTVIVVEHDPDVIQAADHVVDLGPGAGKQGGEVVFQGSYAGLVRSDTLTGRHLRARTPVKTVFRAPSGKLAIRGARVNNLKDVSVDIPCGVLTVVTGVAGSGKSSLINEVFLAQHPDAVAIDQAAAGVSTRSNPATYTGVLDDIRKAFAAANGVSASLFSFNSKGACPNCQGLGVIYTDLAFLGAVKVRCEICEGRRFKDEVLTHTLEGRTITDVLALTVSEALNALRIPEVTRKLQAMSDVGLDYLTLGQPLSTLSGGECQRIKLASELHQNGSIYVLDEPTTGLHLSDVGNLLSIMNRLVDGGNTVIVIEHNMAIIANADWIIDMGPEGGHRGGEVVFEGTPRELLKEKQSSTGSYLRRAAAST
ncbi:MAG: excinuclease ABC subunit UvrA [Spirochaetia bacterium]